MSARQQQQTTQDVQQNSSLNVYFNRMQETLLFGENSQSENTDILEQSGYIRTDDCDDLLGILIEEVRKYRFVINTTAMF